MAATGSEGLAQTAAYMALVGTDQEHLVIFDRFARATWEQKIFHREKEADGGQITVRGM